jgi:small subunit ribosomal protein S2
MVDLKKLIEAGVHFGHQTWRWNPKMRPYIWGSKNAVHLIDVSKTARQLEKAAQFLESMAAQGKSILWVGTKKPAQRVVEEIGQRLKQPYVTHRWIGGTLTNFPQVKKSVTKLLHYEDVLSKAEQYPYTKKELGLFQKMIDRYLKSVGGIRTLSWPVGAIVVVDVKKEQTAVREAAAAGVPVVALVDTNSDPSLVDYVIPANDDIPRSIAVITGYLAEAVERGKALASSQQQEEMASENTVESMLKHAMGAEEEEERTTAPRAPRRGRTGGPGQRSRRPGTRPGAPRPSSSVAEGTRRATPEIQVAPEKPAQTEEAPAVSE